MTRERMHAHERTEFVGTTGSHLLVGELQRVLPSPAIVRVSNQGQRRIAVLATREPLLRELEHYEFDYLVLAKYMRILSPSFVERYRNRIVNIHHSFLPAFAGSNPYQQAFDRGVKIIGATAHFINDVLDEGPIIAQSIVPIDHSYRPREMAQAGLDVEKIVFA